MFHTEKPFEVNNDGNGNDNDDNDGNDGNGNHHDDGDLRPAGFTQKKPFYNK